MKTLFTSTVLFGTVLIVLSCGNPGSNTTATGTNDSSDQHREVWMDRGQELAVTAFTALSTELRTALTKGGVAEAVNSCHVSAQFLTDSVAASLGATIRRTTLKPRNPVNAPDAREAEVLAGYQQRADSGLPLQPQLVHEHQTVYYYAPILMQDLCLKCHGTPGETISEQDYALILEKYPDDQAIGYKAGDWRGMWSIAFDAETH